MTLLFRNILVVVMAMFFSACEVVKVNKIAAQAVDKFHEEFNESKFEEIYSGATPGFREATNKAGFLKFMEALRGKLGAYKKDSQPFSHQRSLSAKTMNGETTLDLVYRSDFEKGSASETFTFELSGDTAILHEARITPDAP